MANIEDQPILPSLAKKIREIIAAFREETASIINNPTEESGHKTKK